MKPSLRLIALLLVIELCVFAGVVWQLETPPLPAPPTPTRQTAAPPREPRTPTPPSDPDLPRPAVPLQKPAPKVAKFPFPALQTGGPMEEVIAAGPPSAAVREAQRLLEQLRFAEAEKALQTILRAHPDDADAHAALATALSARHDLTGALAHARRAVRLRGSSLFHCNLAFILTAARDFSGAEKAYRAAIAVNRKSFLARTSLASLLWARDDFEGVEEQMLVLLDCYPLDSYAYNVLAKIHVQRGDLAAAEELFTTYLEQPLPRGQGAREHYALATVRLARGNLKGGEEALRTSLSRVASADVYDTEQAVRSQLLLGDVLLDQGDAAGARGAYQRVVDMAGERLAAERDEAARKLGALP